MLVSINAGSASATAAGWPVATASCGGKLRARLRALAVLRSVFEFRDQMKQIATQLATIAAGEPCEARPIERLDDGIRGRNRL
jgi:hypothetical protein